MTFDELRSHGAAMIKRPRTPTQNMWLAIGVAFFVFLVGSSFCSQRSSQSDQNRLFSAQTIYDQNMRNQDALRGISNMGSQMVINGANGWGIHRNY
jgi:hypothetical protein